MVWIASLKTVTWCHTLCDLLACGSRHSYLQSMKADTLTYRRLAQRKQSLCCLTFHIHCVHWLNCTSGQSKADRAFSLVLVLHFSTTCSPTTFTFSGSVTYTSSQFVWVLCVTLFTAVMWEIRHKSTAHAPGFDPLSGNIIVSPNVFCVQCILCQCVSCSIQLYHLHMAYVAAAWLHVVSRYWSCLYSICCKGCPHDCLVNVLKLNRERGSCDTWLCTWSTWWWVTGCGYEQANRRASLSWANRRGHQGHSLLFT